MPIEVDVTRAVNGLNNDNKEEGTAADPNPKNRLITPLEIKNGEINNDGKGKREDHEGTVKKEENSARDEVKGVADRIDSGARADRKVTMGRATVLLDSAKNETDIDTEVTNSALNAELMELNPNETAA